MGQQQLLILTLVIVIVAIGIYAGIEAYQVRSVELNWDHLLEEAILIANDAQRWKLTPETLNGSPDATKNEPANFLGINFVKMGYQPNGDLLGVTRQCYRTVFGVFELIPDDEDLRIKGYSPIHRNQVTVRVDGILDGDVSLSPEPTELIRGGEKTDGTGPYTIIYPTCG